jgi:transposase
MDIKPKDTSTAVGLDWRKKPRRSFKPEQRLAMVLECERPGVSVAQVAQRNGINANLLFTWRKLHAHGRLVPAGERTALLPVAVIEPAPEAKTRAKRRNRRRSTAARDVISGTAGAIEIELAGARIYLHGAVSDANLQIVLKALARR